MKNISGCVRIVVLFVLLCLLCACKGENALSEYAGSYTLFAYDYEGYALESGDMTSEISLKQNGRGKMTMNGETGSFDEWTIDGESISLRSGEDEIVGTIRDGVLTLDFGDGTILYYARQGADTSGVAVLSAEEYYESIVQSMWENDSD